MFDGDCLPREPPLLEQWQEPSPEQCCCWSGSYFNTNVTPGTECLLVSPSQPHCKWHYCPETTPHSQTKVLEASLILKFGYSPIHLAIDGSTSFGGPSNLLLVLSLKVHRGNKEGRFPEDQETWGLCKKHTGKWGRQVQKTGMEKDDSDCYFQTAMIVGKTLAPKMLFWVKIWKNQANIW